MAEYKREYRVEMLRKGKWVSAHVPNHGRSDKTFSTMAEADQHLVYVEMRWNEYRERCKRFESEMDGFVDWDGMPTRFRIVSRKVTEWE